MCVQVVDIAAEQSLKTVFLDEPAAVSSRSTIGSIVDKNLVGPATLLEAFRKEFSALVTTKVGRGIGGRGASAGSNACVYERLCGEGANGHELMITCCGADAYCAAELLLGG